MNIQLIRNLTFTPRTFSPVKLSKNDQLPIDIMLVGAFSGLMDADNIYAAFHASLDLFPHLTGTICHTTNTILNSAKNTYLELAECHQETTKSLLDSMTLQELKTHFMPNHRHWECNKPLFGIRMVHFPTTNITLLGIRVSHHVVDGSGLSLLLRSCMLHLSQHQQLPVLHDRNTLSTINKNDNANIPKGYSQASPYHTTREQIKAKSMIFTADVQATIKQWNASSLVDARLRLAAWISARCAKVDPNLSEIALWCDVRGLQGIPPHYTGNCGCYLHVPLSDSAQKMTEQYRTLITRQGFKKIAETYTQIQTLETNGTALDWKNQAHVLEVNIVPHSVASVDFGYGKPFFGMLLSRNSPGIRLSITPDEQQFLIEIEVNHLTSTDIITAANKENIHITQRQ